MAIEPTPIQAPADVLTVNNWTLEIPKAGLVSPNFSKVGTFKKSIDTVTQTDGGTGLEYKFDGGIKKHDALTFVRTNTGDINDKKWYEFVAAVQKTGKKYNAILTKLHHGKPAIRYLMVGLLFKELSDSELDTHQAGKLETTVAAEVDWWEKEIIDPRTDIAKSDVTPE